MDLSPLRTGLYELTGQPAIAPSISLEKLFLDESSEELAFPSIQVVQEPGRVLSLASALIAFDLLAQRRRSISAGSLRDSQAFARAALVILKTKAVGQVAGR